MGEIDTLQSVDSIEFTLDQGNLLSINSGAIEVIESPSGVYKIYLTEAQKYETQIITLKFSDEINVFPSLAITKIG